MRNWLEAQRFYWYSLTFTFTPFFWHWEKNLQKYEWGIVINAGPIGMSMIWPT